MVVFCEMKNSVVVYLNLIYLNEEKNKQTNGEKSLTGQDKTVLHCLFY